MLPNHLTRPRDSIGGRYRQLDGLVPNSLLLVSVLLKRSLRLDRFQVADESFDFGFGRHFGFRFARLGASMLLTEIFTQTGITRLPWATTSARPSIIR